MSRMKRDRQFYLDELRYLNGIDPNYPGGNFNHNPECFKTYVRMQAKFAAEDGFEDLSRQMLNRLCDINPTREQSHADALTVTR